MAGTLLAWPALASATTYCVGAGASCPAAGVTKPDVQSALTAASGAADRIVLGPGTFTAPSSGFDVSLGGPLTIVGAGSGPGGTVLTRPALVRSNTYVSGKVLDLRARAVDLSSVAVQLPAPTGSGSGFTETFGIGAGGTSRLHDLAVRTAPGYASVPISGATGLALRGSAAVSHVTVDVAGSSSTKGTTIQDATSAAAPVTIEDSSIAGSDTGLQADVSQVAIRRSTIVGPHAPLDIYDGVLHVESSLLRGFNSRIEGNQPAGAAATIDSSTFVGPGSVGTGLTAATDGGPSSVVLRSSIVDGFATAVERMTFSTGPATLSLAQDNLRADVPLAASGPGSTTQSGTTSADPGFVDAAAGDYRLTATSPLIDRGLDPAPAGLGPDLDGNPRILDGDGDGHARLDVGAYERPAPPAVPGTPSAPEPGKPTPPVAAGPSIAAAPPAGFGAKTAVALALRATRSPSPGRLTLTIANRNAFAVGARADATVARAGRRKPIRLAPVATTVVARATRAVRLRLSAPARRALRSSKRLSVRVSLRLTAPDGGRRTVTTTLTARVR